MSAAPVSRAAQDLRERRSRQEDDVDVVLAIFELVGVLGPRECCVRREELRSLHQPDHGLADEILGVRGPHEPVPRVCP